MIIAVTGHRPNKLGNEWAGVGPFSDKIRAWLLQQFDELKPGLAITGMALGVDQIFAQVCIDRKVPFIAAIPCPGQDAKWPASSKRRYIHLLGQAYQVQHVSDKPYWDDPGCMQRRNEWMVSRCDVLLAVWNGDQKGGTFNCVSYAQRMERRIVRFDPGRPA